MSSLLARLRPASSALLSLASRTLAPRTILTSLASSSPHQHAPVPSRSMSGGAAHPEGEILHLTGRQFELALLGNFPDAPTVQPFGTLDRPALIYSGLKSRIVGCIGGGHYSHRLQWFQLKEGKKHVCSHCGQVFLLVNDKNFESLRHLVDERTREHFDYFKTLALSMEQASEPGGGTAVPVEVGPHSKY